MTAIRWLDRNLERVLVAALLASIVLLIAGNVVMRYVFNASLSWGEELTLWFFVWFIWLAVSLAFQKQAHIRITVFRDLVPKKFRKAIDITVNVIILIFLVVLIVECMKLIQQPFVTSQRSVVLGLPIPVLYASAPIGAALSCFRILQHLYRTIRNYPRPESEEVLS